VHEQIVGKIHDFDSSVLIFNQEESEDRKKEAGSELIQMK
jgi:hypothetical protein